MNYWQDPRTHDYIEWDNFGYHYCVAWRLLGIGAGSVIVETFQEVQIMIWLIKYVSQGREKGLI